MLCYKTADNTREKKGGPEEKIVRNKRKEHEHSTEESVGRVRSRARLRSTALGSYLQVRHAPERFSCKARHCLPD